MKRVGIRLGAGLGLLIALWAAAAIPAVGGATDLVQARTTVDQLGRPVDAVVVELQAERRLSTAYLAGAGSAALVGQRIRTDRVYRDLRDAVDTSWRWVIESDAAGPVDDLVGRLGRLSELRAEVDARRIDRGRALSAYTEMVDGGLVGAPWLLPSGAGLVGLSRAREALAQEDAMLRGALIAGRLDDGERARLADLAGARRALLGNARYQRLRTDLRYLRLQAAENELVLRPAPGLAPADWAAAVDPVNADLRAIEVAAVRDAAAATPGAVATIVYAGLIGGVGLVVIVAILVMARRAARPGAATPATAGAGTGGAGTGGAGTGGAGIGGAGAGEAERRLQALLLDLHRRSQNLLHRQLRLLDGMERRESDDETLGDLFRADHLAARMRRNVEKAIMLAGGTPGRRWSRPVPMVDVVRGAAAEVAEYGRVSTSQIEPAGLSGAAVTDLMHLLAELIDNATSFAPAETRVRVSGERSPDGYTLAVVDSGPGMSDDDLVTAHQVIGDPEPPGGGTWWGLYALGRFADRQGITVRLSGGPAGGLVAEVSIPPELLTRIDPATEPTVDLTLDPTEVLPPAPRRPVTGSPAARRLGTGPSAARQPGTGPSPAPQPGTGPSAARQLGTGPPIDRVARMRERIRGADSPETVTTTELPALDAQRTTP